MPDFNLPGISSNIDIKGIIDKLVSVESRKLDRFEAVKEQLNKEKTTWITLNNKINNLQKASEALYGFRSPFEDKIAISSDEGALSAAATRIAQPSTSTINVEQIALNERILSDPVENNRILGETYLKINIGEEEVDVRFGGGRIDDLAEAINRQAGAYLTAKITRDTDKTAVLVLEVNNTGEKNRIAVDDGATSDFFRDIGLFKEESGLEVDTEFKQESIFPIEESSEYRVYDEVLTLEPENSVEFILDKSVMADPNVYLKIKIRAVEVKEEEKPEEPVLWPELKNIGKVTIRDVSVEGGRSISKIEVPEEEKVEPVVIDNKVIGIGNEAGLVGKLDVDALADNFTEYTFRLTDILKEDEQINRIFFINRNTGRRIEYRGLVLEDTSVREGISPKHPVQTGRDAVLYIDGVKIIRDTNEFEDVIKGVKIKLKKESKEEVLLTTDRDYEKITGKIVELVSRYNELLKYINEQTGATVSEMLSEENVTGILSGDITVMGLKSKLQRIMMDPYPTGMGKELSMLVQIGISTGAYGSDWSDIKEGYLHVAEDKFITAFEKFPEMIKQLFGSDTNNDVAIDNGVAYVMDKTLKGYISPRNGVIINRIKNTDTGIKEQEKSIDSWNVHIEEYRKKLERDFTVMQQALNELDLNTKRIENFSRQFQK